MLLPRLAARGIGEKRFARNAQLSTDEAEQLIGNDVALR